MTKLATLARLFTMKKDTHKAGLVLQRKIKALSKSKGATAEFARRSGISQQELARLKRAPHNVQLSTIEKLAAGFGQPIGQLLDELIKTPDAPVRLITYDAADVLRLARDAQRVGEAVAQLAETAQRLAEKLLAASSQSHEPQSQPTDTQ